MGNNPPGATTGDGNETPNTKGLGVIGKSLNNKITNAQKDNKTPATDGNGSQDGGLGKKKDDKDASAVEEEKKGSQEAKDSKGAEDSKSSEVGTMKPGDYMVHIFIETAKQLKVTEGQTVDPIIEVEVLNERKYTTAKEKIGAVAQIKWNEHLFFEPKNVTQEAIEGAKIQIKLKDKGFFKETLIGYYEFDIAWVYFQKQHSLLHKWVALSNPESPDFNEVAGYLKLSMSVSTVGDEQIQITEDQGGNSDESILMPPSIRPEFFQIKFKFYRAEHLPAMDRNFMGKGGSIDAYIMCQYLNNKLKTDVVTAAEGDKVYWNCEFLVPCQLPIMSSRIVMKVMDRDLVKDEVVGSILFDLKDCIKDGKLVNQFFWKNIYGAPIDKSGTNTEIMNSNPELASTWKGRILMKVESKPTERPVCLKQQIEGEYVEVIEEGKQDQEIPVEAQEYIIDREYDVIAEVGQGLALPSESKYKVMIKIGEHELLTSDPIQSKGCYNRWLHRFPQQTMLFPYKDIEDIGSVFIYLISGKEAISFFKADVKTFMNKSPEIQWLEMNPDLSIGKVKDHYKAGIVSIKLSIHDKKKGGDINFSEIQAWKTVPKPKRIGVKKVRAYVYQCRDIPAADADGQSDPFIQIWDTTEIQKKTKVIEDNNNPLFYETIEFTIEAQNKNEMPPFVCDIYDKDALSSDFIARTIIPWKEAAISYTSDNPIPTEPKWHQCKMTPTSPASGEILISFLVVELETVLSPLQKVNLSALVKKEEFEIEINILGLRELQSTGILPVKKAFIVFNLKSLVPPDVGTALENVKTQPNSPGSNPTINTMIKFMVPLPVEKLYQPRMLCTVNDYIFKGFNQPLLGSFIIPVGDLIYDLKEERMRETFAIATILDQLEQIIQGTGIPTYSINIEEDRAESMFDDGGILETQNTFIERKPSNNGRSFSKIRDEDESKKPLIQSYHDLEEEEKVPDVATLLMSPRVSKHQLSLSMSGGNNPFGSGSIRRNTVNPMKIDPNLNKFAEIMKKQLIEEKNKEDERKQRMLEDRRSRDVQELKKALGKDSVKNIIDPKYEEDKRLKVDRESQIPPETLFMGLGWDEDRNTHRKHYRRFYPKELETVTDLMPKPTPFETYNLMRGQSRGASKGLWPFGKVMKTDESGQISTEQVVGKFKGIVTVQTEKDKEEYKQRKESLLQSLKQKLNTLSKQKVGKEFKMEMTMLDTLEGRNELELQFDKLKVAHLNITKQLTDLESDETLKRLLLQQAKCMVRIYVIDAYNLSSRDQGDDSDPYLVVSLGNKTYNQREKWQLNEPNPKFHQMFDFEATFPGCPPLVIKIMDYDEIFGDDTVGTSSIDLEDRYFSPEWQSIMNKPIEFRSLYHPSSRMSQGTVRCWVEIHPLNASPENILTYDITPKPLEEFEVRVCIFNTKDVPSMDIEGVSDVFCRAFFDSKEDAKETDTHYRCGTGAASFNYRLLYRVKHPRSEYNFTVQLYDRDLLSSNEIIASTTINLSDAFSDSSLTKKPVSITKKYHDTYLAKESKHFQKGVSQINKFEDANTFWMNCKGANKEGVVENICQVRLQIDIIPVDQADANKVGDARSEPNHSPTLPPPEGRIKLTANPIEMALQMVGPEQRKKIIRWFFCAICLFLCAMLAPLIAGNLLTEGINWLIGCITGSCGGGSAA